MQRRDTFKLRKQEARNSTLPTPRASQTAVRVVTTRSSVGARLGCTASPLEGLVSTNAKVLLVMFTCGSAERSAARSTSTNTTE